MPEGRNRDGSCLNLCPGPGYRFCPLVNDNKIALPQRGARSCPALCAVPVQSHTYEKAQLPAERYSQILPQKLHPNPDSGGGLKAPA